ncbi:hypothetical protein COT12_01770 [Candidatus Berkelbacteria bacterium CG08_land_8_20_14_0_20_39_8]|uniref:Uncharacterized protein n=1 Tax=Candidatus Berkelbacteria bacterium CG08_land_8_20_14_0_20_39_8 TaxID=1974511 RepID=A0A2M6YC84_9BACT|nr:MAG: hypothetical protein COT12_01770 [Candidatus Berkelbacteria bacterium CG08_land_8_20_14_0_20_39_8]
MIKNIVCQTDNIVNLTKNQILIFSKIEAKIKTFFNFSPKLLTQNQVYANLSLSKTSALNPS